MKARLLLAGCGNIGGELVRLLHKRRDEIQARWGVDLELAGIVELRDIPDLAQDVKIYKDFGAALTEVKPDIVIELMGGVEPANQFIRIALEAGAHVITANKAVLAAKGRELYKLAAKSKRLLLAEASVGGAIPVLRTLHTSLAADKVVRIIGVWNGTCNYILTRMEREGAAFADVLADAQRLGYAEANPALDVGGGDTAHKASVLAQLAFGIYDPYPEHEYRGITEFQPEDFREFAEWKLRPKLVGLLHRQKGRVTRYVGPALLPVRHPVATLEGVNNGIYIELKATGAVFLSGPGAGPSPTAATVLGDAIEAGRTLHCTDASVNRWGNPAARQPTLMSYTEASFPCYIRAIVQDKPGVLAKLAGILAEHGISISSVDQPAPSGKPTVPLYFTTQAAPVAAIEQALAAWSASGVVSQQPFWLPILEQSYGQ